MKQTNNEKRGRHESAIKTAVLIHLTDAELASVRHDTGVIAAATAVAAFVRKRLRGEHLGMTNAAAMA